MSADPVIDRSRLAVERYITARAVLEAAEDRHTAAVYSGASVPDLEAAEDLLVNAKSLEFHAAAELHAVFGKPAINAHAVDIAMIASLRAQWVAA